MKRVPMSIKEVNRLVRRWHRHNGPTQGGLFALGVQKRGELVGVAIVGRPLARRLQDGLTCEITRLATDGTLYACSSLLGACVRVARELGYQKIITYTLVEESGTSLRAAGFTPAADVPAAKTWSVPSRPRISETLFGPTDRPTGDKVRWERSLA